MCISIKVLPLYTSKKGCKPYTKVVIQVISSYNGHNHGYYNINTGLEVLFSKSIAMQILKTTLLKVLQVQAKG